MNIELTIKNVGRMWRILDGNKVIGFASDYDGALTRAEQLKDHIAQKLFKLWR